MSQSRNALLLFCKPPIPGLVKTRLTKECGGVLTEDEAAEFFRRCILDIADLSMIALDDLEHLNWRDRQATPEALVRTYDFIVSTPKGSIDTMRSVFEAEGKGAWEREISFMCDQGISFDEHFDDAFIQLFKSGYDNVVAIGGDHPMITREHLIEAFQWLDYFTEQHEKRFGFVQAACQQSGVSLVGLTKETPINSQGVYYNVSGRPALDAYTQFLYEKEIPNAFLAPLFDVDVDADLAHAISCLNAMAGASYYQTSMFIPRRVLEWIDEMGLQATAPPNDAYDPRQYIDSREKETLV